MWAANGWCKLRLRPPNPQLRELHRCQQLDANVRPAVAPAPQNEARMTQTNLLPPIP